MRELPVDFVAHRPWGLWAWGVVTVALSLVAVHQGLAAWRLWKEAVALEGGNEQLRVEIQRAKEAQRAAAEAAARPSANAHETNRLARMAGFPLNSVFNALEVTRIPGVRVTSLDIQTDPGLVTVDLEFTDFEALHKYLDSINAGEPGERWHFVRAQAGQAPAAGMATIASRWHDEGDAQRR
jgi:hypothetical protein